MVEAHLAAEKLARLEERLSGLGSLLVAYSGGVDSAFLAWAAHRVLQDRMLAIIADSPSLARSHLRDAEAFAARHGIPLETVQTAEMEKPEYVRNDLSRCFHCKHELFGTMEGLRVRKGFLHLAYGMNSDDRGDFRPGQKAAVQFEVLAPLADVGLTKAEIRTLAHEANLEVWDKPASACLSSRIAYGTAVTRETLARIEAAEAYLSTLGFRQFRVRDHSGLARVEIAKEELRSAVSAGLVEDLGRALSQLGFSFVTLDCQGFRSGSMNPSHANRLH